MLTRARWWSPGVLDRLDHEVGSLERLLDLCILDTKRVQRVKHEVLLDVRAVWVTLNPLCRRPQLIQDEVDRVLAAGAESRLADSLERRLLRLLLWIVSV